MNTATISLSPYPIVIGSESLHQLQIDIAHAYSRCVVLMDENTYRDCYPILQPLLPENHVCLAILAGEIHKTLSTTEQLWRALTELQIDRQACVLNLGGGVVGDMGGFVASTYKRGIDFFQLPTSLLAQVDAAVGGKVGIDFGGYKNQLGTFSPPKGVYIYPSFLATLPTRELNAGFAEMMKHALIADADAWLAFSEMHTLPATDAHSFWEKWISHAIQIKAEIVAQDPFEKGKRKILNFGHTVGHAIESYFLGFDTENLLHGEAVALGMIVEAHLSYQANYLNSTDLQRIVPLIHRHFQLPAVPQFAYTQIWDLMKQDKKNHQQAVRCVLLEKIGQAIWDCSITFEAFKAAMDYYCATTKNIS